MGRRAGGAFEIEFTDHGIAFLRVNECEWLVKKWN